MKYKLPVFNGINFGIIGAVGTWAFFIIVHALTRMTTGTGSISVSLIRQVSFGALVGIFVGFLIGLIVEFIFRNKNNPSNG